MKDMGGQERFRRIALRLGALLGPDAGAVVQSTVALLVSLITTLAAGLTLASAEERLASIPGLLLLVPAAIAQRGNVFGALGSRLGTAIHTGTFRISTRSDSFFGQNVLASIGLSWVAATWLALVASVLARLFGVSNAMGVFDFLSVSIVGGMLASLIVLGITVALAAGSTRFGWDLDNVTAPLVTATGDLVTLPALLIGSLLVARAGVTLVVGVGAIAVALLTLGWIVKSSLQVLRQIVRDSVPVLGVASVVSLLAGLAVERQLSAFLDAPALLVLVPTYFGMAGALGGILASRFGSKVHLGLIESSLVPPRTAWQDIRSVILLAVPIFSLVGVLSHLGSVVIDVDSPGLLLMFGIALSAGLGALTVVVAVAYYGTLAAVRFGIDPDTASIPLTNSVLDLVGAFTLVAAIVAWGVAP